MAISDDPKRFQSGSRLIHEDGRELVVAASRAHNQRLLVRFEGVGDRDSAEDLRGALYVDAETSRPLEADQFWHHDLIGCAVIGIEGIHYGEVVEVTEAPAQDLLTVRTASGDRQVPLVKAIVVKVDLDARVLTVDPPDGLL